MNNWDSNDRYFMSIFMVGIIMMKYSKTKWTCLILLMMVWLNFMQPWKNSI